MRLVKLTYFANPETGYLYKDCISGKKFENKNVHCPRNHSHGRIAGRLP